MEHTTLQPVLAIAGSDSSGGAGIQADLKTMLANGVFGMSAITALTAQNTTGVRSIQDTEPSILADQIDAVFDDIPPVAVKIGMVSSVDLINAIADRLTAHHATNVVLDPVMVATSGAKLISDDAIDALTSRLFPLATVITPNIPETCALTGLDIDDAAGMERAALALTRQYGCASLVKGGHNTNDANDVLAQTDGTITWFEGKRVDNPNTHGTGCTLSSAIASHLALGETLPEAIRSAKAYLTGELHRRVTNHLEHIVDVAFDVGEHGVRLIRQAGLSNHIHRLRHVGGFLRACAGRADGDGRQRVDVRLAGFRIDRHFLLFGIAVKGHDVPRFS